MNRSAGEHIAASFKNLDYCRTTIRLEESGNATFAGYDRDNGETRAPTIEILNCHNLELDGHGIKVLDAYGESRNHGQNESAVYIGKASSCINIHHLDIQNPSGFAGIMAKDSPECDDGTPVDIANPNEAFMHHIYLHHNYIHNIPQGEGIYAGDTGFMTGRVRGSCGRLFPQKIEHVWIYENFLEEIGLDAIQLGSCITGGKIYKNFCVEYGTIGDGGMSNGIQIGLGNIGTVCERNFIRQSSERAENAGHGILCQGTGNNCITNNIIYNTQENAIYVAEQTAYCYREDSLNISCTPVLNDTSATCKGYAYFGDNISETLTGANIIHNTLMYPAKAPRPAIGQFGIRMLHLDCKIPPTGGAVKNNSIFGTATDYGVTISNSLNITCKDNAIISEDWKTVRDDYLDSFGPFTVPDDVPYTAAMQEYFTRPAINEEDNYFRSPTDFYPVHPTIINSASIIQTTDECEVGDCLAGEDFFEMDRSTSTSCANDYGAVELTAPVFSINKDCENGMFTIHPADTMGTFIWTFADTSTTALVPTFAIPGVGIYPLTYSYTSSDSCTNTNGIVDIELACGCPCDGEDAINIEAGTGTYWHDTDIMNHVTGGYLFPLTLNLHNRCLSISGRLLVNDIIPDTGFFDNTELYIHNGYIRMQPGAEIVVQTLGKLRIENVNAPDGENGAGIHGCDFMWEGIDVEKGGRIVIKKSVIQDAITALSVTDSAYIQIQHNSFENNFRGIDIAPFIPFDADDPNVSNNPVRFSLLTGPYALSDNYFGTTSNGLKGTVNTTFIPPGTRGEVGIKMAYLNFLLVRGEFPAGANVFENLRHGVYANQSSLIMMGNTFREVDYGARLYNSPAYFISNIFDDVAVSGIESLDAASLTATNNVMQRMHQRGINYEGAKHLNSYRIRRNRISSKDHCISIEASPHTTRIDVSDNNLTLRPLLGDEEFPGRAAMRVFNVGNSTLDIPTAQIKNHLADGPEPPVADIYPEHPIGDAVENRRAITIYGSGDGIVLENMSHMEINYNQVRFQQPSGDTLASHGIRLANSPDNKLYGNSVQAVGGFPDLRSINLSGSARDTLCCNSTDGGAIGMEFLGICNSTVLRNTIIGNHNLGLQCGDGARIGIQEHTGNDWIGNYGEFGAQHLGDETDLLLSGFIVASVYLPPSIWIPQAPGAPWFEQINGFTPSCTADENIDCLPIPTPNPSGGNSPSQNETDRKIAEGDYATGKYAIVHNWEAQKHLFDRLDKDQTLRNSDVRFQNFYQQTESGAIGDYVRASEQFKTLLNPTTVEHQTVEELETNIQENLKILTQIGEAYSQSTSESNSTILEVEWHEKYIELSRCFTQWHELAVDLRQQKETHVITLQADNTALSEDIIPAASEKFMDAVQLQRITGEPITKKQEEVLVQLAFSCPLKEGNAVYRARSLLRTVGSYVFDDTANCEQGKEETEGDGRKSVAASNELPVPQNQWLIYPNPTQGKIWLEGPTGASLSRIQLYNHLGRIILNEQGKGNYRQELTLPSDLSAGLYFVVLVQANGNSQTHKLIVEQ